MSQVAKTPPAEVPSEDNNLNNLAGFLDILIQIDLNNRDEQVKK